MKAIIIVLVITMGQVIFGALAAILVLNGHPFFGFLFGFTAVIPWLGGYKTGD